MRAVISGRAPRGQGGGVVGCSLTAAVVLMFEPGQLRTIKPAALASGPPLIVPAIAARFSDANVGIFTTPSHLCLTFNHTHTSVPSELSRAFNARPAQKSIPRPG